MGNNSGKNSGKSRKTRGMSRKMSAKEKSGSTNRPKETRKSKISGSKNPQPKFPPSMPTTLSFAPENPNVNDQSSLQIMENITPNAKVGRELKKVPLFTHLTELELGKLGGALFERNWPSGSLILQEGKNADGFYILKEGTASVFRLDPETKQQEFLRELTEGDHFGESAIFSDSGKWAASVRCDSYCVMWQLKISLFKKLFRSDRININFANQDALTGEGRGAVDAGSVGDDYSDAPIPKVEMTDEEKEYIIATMKKNPISKSGLFQHFDDESLDTLAQTMEIRVIPKGEDIIQEGAEGDIFYIIQGGEVDVYQTDKQTGEQRKVDHHGVGSSFGELALMHNAVRNATVRATTDVKLRELRRLWVTRLTTGIVLSKESNYQQWLNNVALLSPLTHADRARIAEALEVINITKPGIIFNQGDEADGLYIVAEGIVSFSAKNPKTGEEVEMKKPQLGEGNYFGERALVNNKARSATATADGPCKLLKLDREAFVRLLGPLEDILRATADNYEKPVTANNWKPAAIPFQDLIVVGVLGRGSYGFVQLVKDKNGKTYALKAISKQRIVDTHQKEHTFNEKKYMKELDHPFLIKLYDTYKDRDRIYFLLEPSLGGELFPILRRMRTMNSVQAKFYSAQVVTAFKYLHKKDLVYRDLKPENLLLDDKGYIKITDFGFLKKVTSRTYTMCGTPEYMAPEVISHNGHGRGVDWWTLGIFIFELLSSYSPFYRKGSDNMKMYERIVAGYFNFPSHVDHKARGLITGLLQTKPHKRLGCLKNGAEDVIKDKWYEGFDWQGLLWQTLKAPMKVKIKGAYDVSNFKQTVREKNVKEYVSDGTNWDDAF